MPIYHYRCGACGHTFEQQQRMSDDKLTDCPECNDNALKRVPVKSTFSLKGARWEKDGYGR